MKTWLIAFVTFTFHLYGNILTNNIQDIPNQPYLALKAFGLNFSGENSFSYLSKELEKFDINLQMIDCGHTQKLSQALKNKYCSKNVSSYLLAQILTHLTAYQHCLQNNIPLALMLEKNAFIYSEVQNLFTTLNELEKLYPKWDILFTDLHYHLPKDGSIAKPQITKNNKIIPTHKALSNNISSVNSRYGTVSYIISLRGMNKILEYYTRNWLDLPFDQALFKIPRLRIFSVNEDIITNEHRCEKYDQYQKKRILDGLHTSQELTLNDTFPLGKISLDPHTILNPNNWSLIYQYILEKFTSKPLNCIWLNTLLQKLPIEEPKEQIILSKNGDIISGSKEIASSLISDKKIEVTVVEDNFNKDSKSLNNEVFLNAEEKDFIASQILSLFPNLYVVCLFPLAEGLDNLTEEVLNQFGEIIYKKEIHLTADSSLDFIKLIYQGEGWLGTHENNYKLGKIKASRCFPKNLIGKSPLRVYLYSSSSLERVKQAKAQVRKLYQCSNDSIHISDTKSQALLIGTTVFNEQSIKFLNTRLSNSAPNFDWLFTNLQISVLKDNLGTENFCIDSSGVLAAYGLRDCQDLDAIHDINFSLQTIEGIDSHNSYLKYYPETLDNILWNPGNHFYFNGIKFVSLDLVKQMKIHRNNNKDIKDVLLISSFQKSF